MNDVQKLAQQIHESRLGTGLTCPSCIKMALAQIEREQKARLQEIQRQIAVLKNPHIYWDMQNMGEEERAHAIRDLENEFLLLTEAIV